MELHLGYAEFKAQAQDFCALWRRQPGVPADWAWAELGAEEQQRMMLPEVRAAGSRQAAAAAAALAAGLGSPGQAC
jgi:hypothetical protein